METVRTHKRYNEGTFYVNQSCPLCHQPLVSDGNFVFCSGRDKDNGGCTYFTDIRQGEDQCSG